MRGGTVASGRNDCAAGVFTWPDPPHATGHPSRAACRSDFFRGIESSVALDELVVDWMTTTDVWWTPGNHDTDSLDNDSNIFKSALAGRGLHGRVTEIARIALAGMVGVFRCQICLNCRALDAPLGFLAHGEGFFGFTDRHSSTVPPGRFDKAGVHWHERDVRA